ncbi:hypothetical protein [Sinorhizobium fredii]|uniref:hypothetical protein n=1 Tax=Rhizobium fredii TaxID=380 RepID=UPI00059568B3|nr:hypothetical protein [Sinorhizobium fredii]WOS62035.1 hypothetical protein SFGR64A_13920 [Sinorhizobium fredii GR64]
MKPLTLHITDLLFERAYILGKEKGFKSLGSYLYSVIEDAVLKDWYDREFALEEPEKLLEEDEGGGMRLIDDDIPF